MKFASRQRRFVGDTASMTPSEENPYQPSDEVAPALLPESPSGATGITAWLERAPGAIFAIYAIGWSFSTYFCMYAFRKPFSVGQFQGLQFLGTGIDLKTAFVISQILGYTTSKFIGIKVCSEVRREQRAKMLVGTIAIAQVGLVLFGLAPNNLKVAAIFLAGLPLGMVWGLVVWYLEGRRTSELLLAGLSCSYIVASSAVKDIGQTVIRDFGVSEAWMPSVVGWMFLVPFVVSVYFLNQLPGPSAADVAERTKRETMDATHRFAFVRHFLLGMIALIAFYFFLTAYRDFRDNYMPEVLTELGLADKEGIFSLIEWPIGFSILLVMAALSLFRNNRYGLLAVFVVMISGMILMGLSTLMLDAQMIDGFWWMVLIGFGAYLAYVPFGSVLFDRMLASTHVVGTAVFAIYLTDATGYTGSVIVQLYKDLYQSTSTRFEFLHAFTYFVAVLGVICLVGSCVYFLQHGHRHRRHSPQPSEAIPVS
ncbi:MAG: hypothetical protein DWQ31_01460 [Planctomycetota bacterium]|nr:MAG: hypothetical protein DWQ31_01460 [Planctomycetota bacterium]REJ95049.1 MAG: hypothetical protein DWQ35_07290 [Planctomycetota bacterium]REK25272.1 MAG: hypothetical protein DWQ42_11760 [Planctomycetota bacterium]REK49501.1 MAG: hypothetical protein DWQ46_00055 [Planctomycetota bacterium]